MTRILIRDLEPGRLYHIQARATNGEESSQWSQLWDLETTSDIMPPAAPTGLEWTVEGTAFRAVWAGPTTNEDGTPLMDLRDYQIKLYSPLAPSVVATYYVTSNRFDFTFESNVNAFGTPRASVNIEIRARDNTGNLSSAATASAVNPPPADVANFAAVGIVDAVALKWDPNADDDLKTYKVWQGLEEGNEDNLVFSGLATSFVYETIATVEQYFKIVAVDVFNSESVNPSRAHARGKSSMSVDTDPPAVPTNVEVTSALDPADNSGGSAYIDVSWTGVADTDLQNYSIRYGTDGSIWQYINIPEGVTSGRINGLRPGTEYYVAVSSVDYSGNSSAYTNAGDYPLETVKDTTPPAAVSGLTVGAGLTTLTAYWDENEDVDVKNGIGFYEIQIDTVNTFDSGNLLTKQAGGTIASFANLVSNTTYYVRVRAVDAAENRGDWSSIISGTPRYVQDSDIQAGSISGDKITANTLAGDRVIANSLDANTLKANTTFSQNLNVGSTFTMATSGIMKSANYSAGVSGWQLTNNTLEINQGTIRAAALMLQNGHNMLHPAYADFEFVKAWYTNNIVTFNDGGTSSWSIADVTDVVAKYNTQCIKTSWTGTGTYSRTYLGATFTSYNTQLDTATDYILSCWVYLKPGAGAKRVALGIKLANNTFPGPVGDTTISTEGVWTRISGVFNSGTQTSAEFYLSQYTSGDVYWDGLQLEKKLTADNTPSQWKPPSATSIDGGIIRTGSIQSNAPANGLSGQPAWSINVQGNAQFGDALVRGRLVVGDPNNPSADGVNSRIHSANYVQGSSGWIIRNDGYAEFRQIAVNSIRVTAFDSPFQQSANSKMFDYMQDSSLWVTSGSVSQKSDAAAYSADSLFEFTGPGVVFRNGTGVKPIAFDPTILYRISARVRAFDVATVNANSGFETDTNGWFAYGTNSITRDTTKAFSGSASVRWDQVETSAGVYGMGTSVTVRPGYDYTFSARVLPNNVAIRDNLKMNIVWKNADGTTISITFNDMAPPVDENGNPIPIDGTTWIQFSSMGTAPTGAATASFEVQAGESGVAIEGIQGWFDDVTITTPPRISAGLFGIDGSDNIVDYDFVDGTTTPTKRRPIPTDHSLLSTYAPNQYMLIANNSEVPTATNVNSSSDWITITGYIQGRGGYGSDGNFGRYGMYLDEFSPSAFNQEIRYMIPYVEFDIPNGSTAQLDQFSIEAYESGAVSKVDTTGTTNGQKAISIDNIQDGTRFDHALRFYSGETDESAPGLIGHITDGENKNAPHLRISPPIVNKLSSYDSEPHIGIWDQNPNYLYNASFEEGISGWTGVTNTSLSWNQSTGREDTASLQIQAVGTISNPATTELIGRYQVPILGSPELLGQRITVSGYAMMGTATGRNVRLVVKFLNESGGMINGYFVERALTNTDWLNYAFTTPIAVPDNCVTVEFYFSWFNGAVGDIVLIDDVQLEAGTSRTNFRSASASKVAIDSDVFRSRGAIIVGENDFTLPPNVIGGLGKPDAPRYKGLIAQSEGGTAAWRNVNYTDTNGQRSSAQMTFYSTEGQEEGAVRVYGLNDASFPGQVALTSPNGEFALATMQDSSGDSSLRYNTRIYGSLQVDGTWAWIPIAAEGGVSAFRTIGCMKVGGQVFLRGSVSLDSGITRGTVVGTLPVGYRPWTNLYMSTTGWTGTGTGQGTSIGTSPIVIQVNSAGEITLYSVANNVTRVNLPLDGLNFPLTDIVAPGTGGGTPGDVTAPGTPSGFSIAAASSGTSTGTYTLSWNNPSASDTAGVKIIWRSDRYPTVTIASSGTKTLTTDGNVINVSGSASQSKKHTHSGLPVNKTIYYRVVSYDKSGNHSTYVSASRYLLASPVTISANSSASYRLGYGGMWRNDGDEVYQGDWTSNDNHRGLFFYGNKIYSELSKGGVVRTPTKMTIYVKRLSTSHGNNARVKLNLRGHTYSSKPSGDPAGNMTNEGGDGTAIASLNRGESATITIPSSWYNNFVTATSSSRLRGLGFYASTSSEYSVLNGKSAGSSHGKVTIYHKG